MNKHDQQVNQRNSKLVQQLTSQDEQSNAPTIQLQRQHYTISHRKSVKNTEGTLKSAII